MQFVNLPIEGVEMDVASKYPFLSRTSVRMCRNVPIQLSAGPATKSWREDWCKNCATKRRQWTNSKNLQGAQGVRSLSLARDVLTCSTSPTAAEEFGATTRTGNLKRNEDLPSMSQIVAAAEEKGVKLELKSLGPYFSVQAFNLAGADLGRAEGFILPWVQGGIVHLDSIRLTKMSAQNRTSVLGVGLFIGAASVRHGLDSSCTRAELLAINDSPEFHAKLVRYYTRLGFNPVYEVTGGRLQDIPHMLVWGGVGTRMDADVRHLLQKWSSSLRPGKKTDVFVGT